MSVILTSQDALRHASEACRAHTLEGNRLRDDGKIHVSANSDCPRKIHYQVNKYVKTDAGNVRMLTAAHMGTAWHEFHLPALAESWRSHPQVESVDLETPLQVELDTGHVITGTPDLLLHLVDGTMCVLDVKTMSTSGYKSATSGSPRESVLNQVAATAVLAELVHDKPVSQILLDVVHRAYPDERSVVRFEFDDAAASRGNEVVQSLALIASDMQYAPRWFGTATGEQNAPYSECLSCPFRTRCLGKDLAIGNAEANVDPEVRDQFIAGWKDAKNLKAETVKATEEYLKLKHLEKAAEYREGKFSNLAEHFQLEAGKTYNLEGGRTITVTYRNAYKRVDTKEARAILEKNNLPVPTYMVSGSWMLKEK